MGRRSYLEIKSEKHWKGSAGANASAVFKIVVAGMAVWEGLIREVVVFWGCERDFALREGSLSTGENEGKRNVTKKRRVWDFT